MARFPAKCLRIVLQCLFLGLLARCLGISLLSGACVLVTDPARNLKWVFLEDILISGAAYGALYLFLNKLIKDTVVALRRREP
ncbi:MAG: hypothetical protein U0836_10615 [Pirellulales bacterium]